MSTFTLTPATDHFTGTAGSDTVSGLVENFSSADALNGVAGLDTLMFTDAGTILSSQFSHTSNFANIVLGSGVRNDIAISNHVVAQAHGPLTITGGAAATNIFDVTLVTTPGSIVLNGGAGTNYYDVEVPELGNVTINGVAHQTNSLRLYGGGDVNMSNVAASGLTSIALEGTDQFFLTLNKSLTVLMGGSSDTVVVGADSGNNNFSFGASGQTAIGGGGNDTFGINQNDYFGSTAEGAGGVNTLSLSKGGVFDLACMNLTSIQKVSVDGSNTSIYFDNFGQNYQAALGGGLTITSHDASGASDQFDLRGVYDVFGIIGARLVGGNGDDTVWVGQGGQSVSLGTGDNTVLVSGDVLGGDSEGGSFFGKPIINGGTGTGAQDVGNSSLSTLVITCLPYEDGCITMSSKIVGFHAVDLGFYDKGDLSFFFGEPAGEDPAPYSFFTSDADFKANGTAGLVIYGTLCGDDTITLNATDQSYIAGGDGVGPEPDFSGDGPGGNLVILNAGGLTAATNGTVLDGGSGGCNTLELRESGIYDFTAHGVTVENFQTVRVDGSATTVTLTLNDNDGDGYLVNAHVCGAVNYAFSGGAGNEYAFYGEGTVSGSIDGGTGGFSDIVIHCGAAIDLGDFQHEVAITNIENIDVASNASLSLTSDQILNDGFTLSDSSSAQLTVYVSGDTLNVADLHVENSGLTLTIFDNNDGDTIYGGPDDETIVLGTGNDWVNAGSGDNVIVANTFSGSQSVLIAGDGNDTFEFGNGSSSTEPMVTEDTILGANQGDGTLSVVVVAEATVDFTGATFSNIDTLAIHDTATAIVEITQLANFATGNHADFAITAGNDSTLEVIADLQSNTITDVYSFTGGVLVDVTATNTVTPVIVDVSGISNSVTIEAASGRETITLNDASDTVIVGSGVETINGGTGTDTLVFEAGHASATNLDTFVGAGGGGSYVFEIEQDTDFTGATFSGAAEEVTAVIAPGVTAVVNSSDVDQTGFFVEGGTASSAATLDIRMDSAAFTQSLITVESSYIDEIVTATTASSIDLTTSTTLPELITVNDSAGIDNIIAGSGAETLHGNGGADVFTFATIGSVTDTVTGDGGNDTFQFNDSVTFTGSIDGGTGSDTLNIGITTTAGAIDADFSTATITNIELFNIGNGDLGTFQENALFGSIVSDDGTLEIYVDSDSPSGNVLSVAQSPIGPVAANATFTLTLGPDASTSAAVIIHANDAGDKIQAGTGAETIYDGAGADTIASGGGTDTIVLQGGGADTLFATTGSTVTFDFDPLNSVIEASTDTWLVTDHGPTTFMSAPDTIDGATFAGGATGAAVTIEVSGNTDFTGATFTGLSGATLADTITVGSGASVVFSDTELAAFQTAGVNLTGATDSNLVIDDTSPTFAPTLSTYDLTNWSGSVTIVGDDAGQTINVALLHTTNFGDDQQLYIFGGAGNDTFVFNGDEGEHGGILDGGAGANTLQVSGSTDFTGGGTASMEISHIGTLDLTNDAVATFTYNQAIEDVASLGTGSLVVESSGGNHNYTVEIDGTGNMDLSHIDVSGFSANIANGFSAIINVVDDNDHSVTVVGTANGASSADIIEVNGHGDTVIAGPGADLIDFGNYNVANNYQFRFSDLGTQTMASGANNLAAEGDITIDLKNHDGYLDLTGFTGVKAAVNTSPTSGIDLGGANGFATYGVVEDSNDTFNRFTTGTAGTTGEKILGSAVFAAAQDIASGFTDSVHGSKGFVTVWDNTGDMALFYVDHEAAGSTIQQSEIKLVGVFDTEAATNPVLSSTFFHIH